MLLVKIMRIKKNIENFLYDQDYFIDLFQNCLHIYYYEELVSLRDTKIELKLKEFNLIIEGENLTISNMDKHELLIKGKINEMRFKR